MKTLLLILLLAIITACSNKGKVTTSKIKISGASAFSAANNLSVRANNGLILYGKSNDGKSFSKKIDTDTVDLEFPNGTWNFYAVAWEIAGGAAIDTGLRGDVSCAKSIGVQLNGTDVQVNLNLSNDKCDADFHPNVEPVSANSGKKMFANFSMYSCKNISVVAGYTNTSDCDFDLPNGKDNKGYATYVRLVVPDYKKFGATLEQAPAPAIISRCMEIDSTVMNGGTKTSETSFMNSMNIPLPGLNGFQVVAQIFYTKDGCDETKGFTTIPLNNSTKQKMFVNTATSTQSTMRYFLEADAAPVCQGPRLGSGFFASGRGTNSLPYTICTKDQFNLINSLYNDGTVNAKNASYELLGDINFQFATINPIGDGANVFYGNFEGRNRRIENFIIDCKAISPSASANDFGLFRSGSNGFFRNLTINKIAMNCDKSNSGYSYNNIGALVGNSNGMKFENIKVFGHVSGVDTVGGIVGNSASNSSFKDVHFEGDVNGLINVGGLVGYMGGTGGSGIVLEKSSVLAEVRGECSTSPCDSFVGGAVGSTNFGASADFSQLVIKLKKLRGSKTIGGVIGQSLNTNINESIVSGLMTSSDWTDGTTHLVKAGGLVGAVENGSFSKNIVMVMKKLNRGGSDSSEGILFGAINNGNAPTCPPATTKPGRNFAAFPNYFTGTACNGDAAISLLQITDSTNYTSDSTDASFATEYPNFSWAPADRGAGKDIPKLGWELAKESQVPYLKRECSGLYATQAGNGSASSPYTICSVAQFNSMSAGSYYVLKKNLFFTGSSPTMKTAGVYRLDGSGYALIDMNFTIASLANGQFGIFKELENGSEIKNLNIISSSLSAASGFSTTGTSLKVGILAGRNNGLIQNVNVENSSVGFDKINMTSVSGYNLEMGGLVGYNDVNGSIKLSDIDVYTKLYQPRQDDDYIFAGSVVGKNYGTIHAVKSHGSLIRSLGSTNTSDFSYGSSAEGMSCSVGGSMTDGSYAKNSTDSKIYACNSTTLTEVSLMGINEYWGGITGANSGNITESEVEGELKVTDMNINTNGMLAPIVGYNSSSATIGDVHYRGRFDSSKSVQTLAVSENNGSITRTIFQPKSTVGFSAGSNVFGGTTSDAICIVSGGSSGCHDSVGSLTMSYTSPTLTISSTGPLGTVNYGSGWNISTGFLPDMTKTWQFEGGELHLMKVGGSFEKLGKGF